MKFTKTTALILFIFCSPLFSGFVFSENPHNIVLAAIERLEEAESFSWDYFSLGSRYNTGTEFGKIDCDGLLHVQINGRRNPLEFMKKGDQFVIKWKSGQWLSMPEIFEAGQAEPWNDERDALFSLYGYRTPIEKAKLLLAGVKKLEKSENGYESVLKEAGAQAFMTEKVAGDELEPDPQNCMGSVRFILKNGILHKLEIRISGRVTWRRGRQFDVFRSSLVEFSVPQRAPLKTDNIALSKLTPLPDNFWK